MKLIKIPAVKMKYPSVNGKKHLQPRYINWSYLYLGKVALVTIKKVAPTIIFRLSHNVLGIKLNKKLLIIGNHPPKNKIAEKVLINSMFAYSPKKKRANVIAEYSTL